MARTPRPAPTALALTLVLAVAAGLAAASPAPAADPAPAPRASSPSAVLRAADASLGSAGVSFPDRPRGEDGRRSLAPYFEVRGDGATERLPLEATAARVDVAGVIARVRVTQTFRNEGRTPIEAIYVFPASTRAAVHGMRVRIGARTIEARIERRAEARARYDQARQDGRRAALLEQERPNVFTMSVANVMPGDRLVAELEYSEVIVPEAGVYELVYPAVVGPRYGGGASPEADGWVATPYTRAGSPAPYRFAFQAHVESAVGIKEITSPSHRLDVAYDSATRADVHLAGEPPGDADVVLRWRLAGDRVESGLLLAPPAGPGQDGYFLAVLEPPARVTPALIPPREYVFVVDVSGSMSGFPLETSRSLLRSLLPRLRPQDAFNVVFFAGSSFALSPDRSLPATAENVRRALAAIDGQRGGGGTELMEALRTAYALPRADDRVARAVVVVTDGYVAVEAQAFRFVRERANEASCFAFGIGSSVNRGLIEALARAGQGEPFVVLAPEQAAAAAERLRAVVEQPVLSRLSVRFEGFDARELAPAALPDLLAERPVVLLGTWRGEAKGRVVLRGQGADGPVETSIDVAGSAPREENAPLRVLWARRWVELLDDERHLAPAKELEEAITDLGLSHRILTAFTSFVAVDSEVVNRTGGSRTVKQPLPLPGGVEDAAVGGVAREAAASRPVSGAWGFAAGSPPPAPRRAQLPGAAADAVKAGEPERKVPAGGGEKAKEPRPALRVEMTAERSEGLAGAPALRDAVRRALSRAAGCLAGGRYELRLVLDGEGRVVRVDVVASPDATSLRCAERALAGLATGARPAARGHGTWSATVTIAR